MAGLEPARACTAQRILSPLRLPFRHIGAAASIVSSSNADENGFPCYDRRPRVGWKHCLS